MSNNLNRMRYPGMAVALSLALATALNASAQGGGRDHRASANGSRNAVSVSSAIEKETAAVGHTSDIYVELANEGDSPISSLDYTVSGQDGQELYTKHLELDGLQLGRGEKRYVYIPVEGGATVGTAGYTIRFDKVNGADNETMKSKQAQFELFTVARAHSKRTVVEEYTGMWCPKCPRGIVGMQHLDNEYPGEFIGIAIHHGDPMQIIGLSGYEEIDGYPRCRIDRTVETDPYHGTRGTEQAPYGIWMDFEDMQRKVPVAGIEVTTSWTPDKNEIDIVTDVTFEYDSDTDRYGIAYALTSDGMFNSNWMQKNSFYGNQTYASDPLFDVFINTDGPVGGLIYDHVVVAVKGIKRGVSDSVMLPIVAGQTQKHYYDIDISTNRLIQDKDKLHLVAMLIDRATERIVNAAVTAVGGSSTDGVESPVVESEGTETHYSLDGRVIGADAAGIHIVRKADGTTRKVLVR